MIKRSLILTTLLLVAYATWVYFIKPEPATYELFKTNAAIAQKFLYEKPTQNKDVVIGTSLADKLRVDSTMPSDIYLLTFLGQHIFDGLEVLEHSNVYPEHVFIETNSILNLWDERLTDYLYEKPYYSVRKQLIILRTGYEPASVYSETAKRLITPLVDRFSRKLLSPVLGLFNVQKQQEVDEQFYTKKLEARFNNITDSFALERFTVLKQKVDRLIKGGSKVCFFTMPVSEYIKQTPMAQVSEKYYKIYFPDTVYNYSMKCNDEAYKTIDGLHMDDSSALRYAAFFKTELTKCRIK